LNALDLLEVQVDVRRPFAELNGFHEKPPSFMLLLTFSTFYAV